MTRALFGFIYVYFVLLSMSEQDSNVTTQDPRDLIPLHWDVWCKYQPNAYDCDGRGVSLPRFYYDIKMQDCKTATFGKCRHNVNQFSSLTACHEYCRDAGLHAITANLSERVYCRLQPDFGECNEYHPMWYFDMTIRTCKGFSYSGCGGNHNRFPSAQICAAVCGGVIEYQSW